MFTLIGLERPIIIGTLVNTPAGLGRVVSAALNVELDHPRHGIGRDCRTYPLAQVRLFPSEGFAGGDGAQRSPIEIDGNQNVGGLA